jgi:hypothetical protein
MAHLISIQVSPGEYRQYEVSPEVYTYIRQLEMCIKYPEKSKLKELYPQRLTTSRDTTQ